MMYRLGKIVIGVVVAMLSGLQAQAAVLALSQAEMDMFSQNNILFYDPSVCSGEADTKSYDNLIIGETSDERLKSVVEAYGELAMDLQREWGTPWEVVFAQMVVESGVGSEGIASLVSDNGYYNWLGITGSGGTYSIGEPLEDGGRQWAQYESIENMIKDWAGAYVARNGYYDSAFSNLSPDKYDIRGFLNYFLMVYAPPSDGNNTDEYITLVVGLMNGTIKEVSKDKGWPSSEELAKNENIPIGGKNPLGTQSEEEDDGGESSGGCVLLRSAPDYDSSNYATKMSNLHDFNQASGTFKNNKMCPGNPGSSPMYEGGCGIMSLYAAYYMFSGQGLNDEAVFNDFLEATQSDGYNICSSSVSTSFGQNTSAFTQMSGETTLIEERYSGDHWEQLVSELEQGKKIITNVIGADGSFFTGGGHYMLFDHYNAEKDMIYLFDPYMNANTAERVRSSLSSADVEYDDPLNGMYLSRHAVDAVVKPRRALVLTYDGCYNGDTSVCRDTADGLAAGGMTYEQAVEFMKPYRTEASKQLFGAYGDGYPNGSVLGAGWINDANCFGGTLNNCSAFTQWFVNNYTTAGPSFGSSAGSEFASKLINEAGFADGGQVPKAYAVFSEGVGGNADSGCVDVNGNFHYNHTGVILGIDTDKNEVYIGQAGCGPGFNDNWPGVEVKSIEAMTNTGTCGYTYAYPEDKLRLEGI